MALNKSITTSALVEQFAKAPKGSPLSQIGTLVKGLNGWAPKAVGTKETGFKGLGDSIYQVDLKTEAQVNNHIMCFSFEYGLTNRISTGVNLTIVRQKVRASFNAVEHANFDAARAMTAQTAFPEKIDTAVANRPTQLDFQKELFTNRGYQVPSDFNATNVADLETGLKYQFHRSENFLTSAIFAVRLPVTSRHPDYSNLLDRGVPGLTDGQLDFGLMLVNDFVPSRYFTLGTSMLFTYQMQDKLRMPVWVKGEGLPPNLNDPNSWDTVERKLGNLFDTEISANFFALQRTLTFYGSYQFKYKQKDRYSGSRPNLDYDHHSLDTEDHAHRYEIGVGYSTVPYVLANRFKLPIDVRLAYNGTIAAKNRVDTAYTRLDLWAYFR